MNFLAMNLAQRRFVFFVIMAGGLLGLLGITWFLISLTLGTGERVNAVSLVDGVAVREFAVLPDDDAYPPTVAVAADGTVYTGSYASGAIWAISADGATISELPDTRDVIGAVSALAVTADGALIVVDQQDTDPRSAGGKLWRIVDGAITPFGDIPEGFSAPNDLAVDAAGRVYVSDPGRNEVWRLEADGSNAQIFWVPPLIETENRRAITGLAYDAATDSLIITDPEVNEIYRAPIAGGAGEIVYRYSGTSDDAPGFDGVTVTPDGIIYVAALGQNGIARVGDGELSYIAGLFRGSSDVEYAAPNRLYVSNFDQASLVIPLVEAQLPFALDVIELP